MGKLKAFLSLHHALRRAQAAYRRRRGLEPTDAKEDPMDKLLALIPKGYGTKTVAGVGILTAVASVTAKTAGIELPASMDGQTATLALFISLGLLYLRRAIQK